MGLYLVYRIDHEINGKDVVPALQAANASPITADTSEEAARISATLHPIDKATEYIVFPHDVAVHVTLRPEKTYRIESRELQAREML